MTSLEDAVDVANPCADMEADRISADPSPFGSSDASYVSTMASAATLLPTDGLPALTGMALMLAVTFQGVHKRIMDPLWAVFRLRLVMEINHVQSEESRVDRPFDVEDELRPLTEPKVKRSREPISVKSFGKAFRRRRLAAGVIRGQLCLLYF